MIQIIIQLFLKFFEEAMRALLQHLKLPAREKGIPIQAQP